MTRFAIWILLLALAAPAAAADAPAPAPAAAPRPAAPVSPAGPAWLGVWLGDAVDGGVQVYAVLPGGPALVAGLRAGDVIVAADGDAVADRADLGRVLEKRSPGQRVVLGVLRGGDSMEVPVELGARRTLALALPAPPGEVAAPRSYRVQAGIVAAAPGIEVADMTPDLRAHYGAPRDVGVLVTRVEADGPAGRAGLRVGDVLVSAGGIRMTDAALVRVTLWPWIGGRLAIEAVRDGKPLELSAHAPQAARGDDAEREVQERRLELEIERLERRLADLRRELDALHAAD